MKSLNIFAVLLLMFTLGTGFVLAQSDRGTIRGTVTDQNDAVVANAKVVVTGVETGETRETTTGSCRRSFRSWGVLNTAAGRGPP